ncbi:hypothetical protein Nepgr_018070 [Nepenthes gracilis]|uniref:Uncharacterized protein n=1 Tax=Nepenthes gracilis TaxID=150966 RepID=A0AAD3XTP8_NEPGR|nr:hypothetical protein Nepgr_018070 [Nepenthes gracilis]
MDGFSVNGLTGTLWHGSGWAPADGMDGFWLKFLVYGLTGHSGMAQVSHKLMEWPAFGSIFGQCFDSLWRLWGAWLREKKEKFSQRVDRT